MDELTSEICTKAKENDTAQLIDWRDRKSYWVTKLKDKNCWMTQNLDYDDPNSTRRTGDAKPDAWNGSTSNQNVREYWDPGLKIVSGSTLAAASDSADRHLLVGNYYSYAAAVNGTAPSAAGDAVNSICPTNWKLPTSNNSDSGSFGGLTTAAGIANAKDEWEKIKAGPYYFQPGGNVQSGALYNAGSQGWYWSSTTNGGTQSYFLYFASSNVNPSGSNNHYYGLSVRCLVLGS